MTLTKKMTFTKEMVPYKKETIIQTIESVLKHVSWRGSALDDKPKFQRDDGKTYSPVNKAAREFNLMAFKAALRLTYDGDAEAGIDSSVDLETVCDIATVARNRAIVSMDLA